jgi:SAM-dependent methyltransferase
MVRATRQRYPGLPVVCGDVQRSPFRDASFDSIFLPWHMICYVDDVEATLREMHRVLKPGGTLLFSMANNWYLRNGPPRPGRHKQLIDRHKRRTGDYLLARYGSMLDRRRFRRIFPFVMVRARVSLQDPTRIGWAQLLLRRAVFRQLAVFFLPEIAPPEGGRGSRHGKRSAPASLDAGGAIRYLHERRRV